MKLEIPGLDDSRRFKTMVHEYANSQSYRYEAMQAFEAKDEKSEKTYLNYLIANIISSMSYRRVGKNIASLKELQALPPYFGYHIKKKEQDRFGRLLSLVAPIMNDEEVAVHVPEDVYNTAYIIQGIAEMIKYTELVNSSVDMINYGIERIAEGNNWQEVFEELIIANSEPDGLAKLNKSKGDNMAKNKNENAEVQVQASKKVSISKILEDKGPSVALGERSVSVASIKRMMDEWTWEGEEDITSDELYEPLTAYVTKVTPVYIPVTPTDPIGLFRKQLGLVIYNEQNIPNKKTLRDYEDMGFLSIPNTLTKEEIEVLNMFVERTSGVETADNKLGNIIRTLAACYVMSDFTVDPIMWLLASLSLNNIEKIREHLALLFAKELALIENNIKDCSLSGACEESAQELVKAVKDSVSNVNVKSVNEVKEEITKEIKGENMKTVVEEKTVTTTVTEDGSENTENKKDKSVSKLEIAAYAAGGIIAAGAVGYGIGWAYNKYFGGNDSDNIELSEFSAF